MKKNLFLFGVLLFLLTACDEKRADAPSSEKKRFTLGAEKGDSDVPTKVSVREGKDEKITDEPEGDKGRNVVEPTPKFDDPEAPVIEPAAPQPIQEQPTGLEGLNLSEDQQQQIDLWISERKDVKSIDPTDLVRHIESLLEEEQKEAFKKMMQASGRSFGDDND